MDRFLSTNPIVTGGYVYKKCHWLLTQRNKPCQVNQNVKFSLSNLFSLCRENTLEEKSLRSLNREQSVN